MTKSTVMNLSDSELANLYDDLLAYADSFDEEKKKDFEIISREICSRFVCINRDIKGGD